jgi:phosphatidylglycerophosphatase A
MKIKERVPAPPVKFLLQHPAHLIACGFGSGLSPWAPGTAGTLFAWVTYGFLRQWLPDDMGFAIFLLLAFALGVAACQITGRALGVVDHGSIVWDEIVPFWAVLLFTPAGLLWQLAAFLAFRYFDIVKPPPANFFDTRVKNGFGVMMDDAVAAAYTVLVLAVLKAFIPA